MSLGILGVTGQTADPVKVGPDPKVWKKTVDKAVSYLKSQQGKDGAWSKADNDGITSVVALALLRSGAVAPQDEVIQRALGLGADKDAAHLAGAAKPHLRNYITSINLLVLHEVDAKRHSGSIKKAIDYLKAQPYDEAKGTDPKDVYYGGVGFGGETRPDLCHTAFVLEALRTAGVPRDDPVFKKILVYVSRSQNLASQHNDQPWAGKINDGSFNYGAGPASQSRLKQTPADAPRPGYGSMTCAGLLALDTCGVKKSDPRQQNAWQWLQNEYSVDTNPGHRFGRGAWGYFYYLQALAQCLDRFGVDEITDSRGRKHNWRDEITVALYSRQQKDGSWANEDAAHMEGIPDLATGWALLALSYCKPRGQ